MTMQDYGELHTWTKQETKNMSIEYDTPANTRLGADGYPAEKYGDAVEDISESDAAKNAVTVDSQPYQVEISARGTGGKDTVRAIFTDNAVWIHVLDDEGNTASMALHREVAHEFFKQITV